MIHFHDEAHRKKVINYLQKENKIYRDGKADGYYLSAFYLLLSTKNGLYRKTIRYIDSDGIDFEQMLAKQDFSSGERKLIKLAANLFSGSIDVSPTELINTLDEENFMMAMQAIFLKRNGCRVKELLPDTRKVPELQLQPDLQLH